MYGEEMISRENHRLEKDIYYLINYIRTNPLDFYNNLKWKNNYNKLNEDQIELINFLENQHDKSTLPPFQEMPEISEAARNLLNNIALIDKKFKDTNLNRLNPSILNLRTRLSNYGDKTGKVFETVVFKINNSEEIVNHILFDDKGRKILLSNKMKYIGVACSILPSNITCSVIDIVQDFYPFRKEGEDSTSSRDNTDGNYINFDKFQSQNSDNVIQRNSYINFDENNNEKNIERGEKQINEKTFNMELSLNNFQNNFSSYDLDDNYNIKPYIQRSHQRLKNAIYSNEWKKNSNKVSSMEFPEEKNNLFSSNSVNSYNIIGNDKIISIKKNSIIKKFSKEKENENENEDEDDNNNIFTMAGRTHKQQEKIIEISTKKNLNKSRSVYDLNVYNKKVSKNKLGQKEKIEILHSINQRNKNPKSLSLNNKILENIINNSSYTLKKNNNINNNNFYIKKSNFTKKNNFQKKNGTNSLYSDKNYNFNSEKDNNSLDSYEINSSNNRSNEFPKRKNEINNLKYYTSESQANEINDYYSKNNQHINQIKSDLILFKNNLKNELKNEVKNELKEEMKNEYQRKPNSIVLESYLDNNNLKRYNKNCRYGLENNEVYNKSRIINKNKIKNRCCSEENICGFKNNPSANIMTTKSNIDYNYIFERKSFDSMTSSGKNDEEGIINNNLYQRNESNDNNYFNKSNKVQNRKEIKKLIKLYNLAKDTQRNKNNTATMYDNSFNDKLNYLSGQNTINKISDNKKDENNEDCYKIKYSKKNGIDFESFNKQKEEEPIFSSSSEIISRNSNEGKNKNISNEQENKNKYNMINKKIKMPISQNKNNLEKDANDNKSNLYGSNSTLKTVSYYKPKKAIPYKYFPFKYKSIDFKKKNNNNNDN